jgi:uncharacterized protein DUF4154
MNWKRISSAAGLSILMCSTAFQCAGASPNPITESEVKAAYLYNFARFIAWPDQSFAGPSGPIQICIISEPSFEATLKEIVTSRMVDGHPVQVMRVGAVAEADLCHILFVSSNEEKRARAFVENLGRGGVLTVGETQEFFEKGGMIRFAVRDGKVQFQVNLRAATQAGVHISARLLGVATRVVQ